MAIAYHVMRGVSRTRVIIAIESDLACVWQDCDMRGLVEWISERFIDDEGVLLIAPTVSNTHAEATWCSAML